MTTRRRPRSTTEAEDARLAEAAALAAARGLALQLIADAPGAPPAIRDLAESLREKIDDLTVAGWPPGWDNALADLARRMLPTRPAAAPAPAPPQPPAAPPAIRPRKAAAPLFSGPIRDKRPFPTP
jgi:hypothetical protein